MYSDAFFYDFFVHRPGELARLLGLDPGLSWTFDSVAVKRVERTIDGKLFCAECQEGPVFVELQGYRDSRIYWRLYNEVTAWWMSRPEKEVAEKSFKVFVIFLDHGHDPKNSPLSPLSPHALVTMTLTEALEKQPELGLLRVLEPLVLKDLAALEARLPHYRALIQQLPGSEEERPCIEGLLRRVWCFPELRRALTWEFQRFPELRRALTWEFQRFPGLRRALTWEFQLFPELRRALTWEFQLFDRFLHKNPHRSESCLLDTAAASSVLEPAAALHAQLPGTVDRPLCLRLHVKSALGNGT